MIHIEKNNSKKPISAIYFDGNKKNYYVKRFLVDNNLSRFNFITNHKDSYLELISSDWRPQIEIIFVKEKGKDRNTKIINLEEFIAVKGEKALGNKLSSKKIKQINLIDSLPFNEEEENTSDMSEILTNNNNSNDEIKLDIKNDNNKGQITLEL